MDTVLRLLSLIPFSFQILLDRGSPDKNAVDYIVGHSNIIDDITTSIFSSSEILPPIMF